jgi:PIN domain nuclease of toxin-antitoxin system
MKLLLDPHLLLRAAAQPDRLPSAARELLDDPRNDADLQFSQLVGGRDQARPR